MPSRLFSLLALLSLIVLLPATTLAGPHSPQIASHPKNHRLAPIGKQSEELTLLVQPAAAPQAGPGAVMTVTTFDPAIVVDGQCSLIEAMINANNDAATHADCPAGSGPDTIELSPGTYTLLAMDNTLNGDNGLPAVASAITVNGHGATIARNRARTPQFRIFYVAAEGNLTLNNLTVLGGSASENTSGGGIRNQGGMLTLNNCTIRDNTTSQFPGRGAGIYNLQGTVIATDTTISNNVAVTGGGGIWNSNGSVVLNNCTIRENTARAADAFYAIGGGLFNSAGVSTTIMTLNHTVVISNTADGPDSGGGGIGNSSISGTTGILTLNDSTVAGNQAAYGAGLWITISSGPDPDTQAFVNRTTISGNTANGQGSGYSDGGGIEIAAAAMVIANSTISGNAAAGSETGTGGGISIYSDVGYPFSSLTLINSTVADNSGSTEGGGIGNMVGAGANATSTFVNTIVADNTAPMGANCWTGGGTLNSLGNNIEDSDTCNFGQSTDHPNTNPLLGTLANNGGPTATHSLLLGSPAIGAGGNSTCAAAPVNGLDQRGISRPQGAHCDIGAYEDTVQSVSVSGFLPIIRITR